MTASLAAGSMAQSNNERYFVVGGAGFIGSHCVDRLLAAAETQTVTIYDNFSSGREWHYSHHLGDPRLTVIRGDVKDLCAMRGAMQGNGVVIHLAANPDIARAVTEPSIDFDEGTCLTQSVLEAMRTTGTRRLLYASGSGVYGDVGLRDVHEDFGPLLPISTYGASKLACEALINAYCHMFGLRACAFRFGNVVGPRQTHGVGFDFIRRLHEDPTSLRILGDGMQSKSYIHILDVVEAVLLAHHRTRKPFEVYNVATGDYLTVKEIADLAVYCAGLSQSRVRFEYTGGDRGWKGDVPVIRLNIDRIMALGWRCSMNSRESLLASMQAMNQEPLIVQPLEKVG